MTTATTSKKFIDPTCTSQNTSTEWKGRCGTLGHREVSNLSTKGPSATPLNVPHFPNKTELSRCLTKHDTENGLLNKTNILSSLVFLLAGQSAEDRHDITRAADAAVKAAVIVGSIDQEIAPCVYNIVQKAIANCIKLPAEEPSS